MLGNRAHEGLQPPSNLEERKGLKEAQHVAHVRSAAHPHPPGFKPVRYCGASCINIWDEEHAASSLVGFGPPGQDTDSTTIHV